MVASSSEEIEREVSHTKVVHHGGKRHGKEADLRVALVSVEFRNGPDGFAILTVGLFLNGATIYIYIYIYLSVESINDRPYAENRLHTQLVPPQE